MKKQNDLSEKLHNKEVFSIDRYRKIPLHAIFLYTTEDGYISDYLLKHWKALDSLSGEFCDIHPTFDQFESKEDAYDFVDKLDILNESNFNSISRLPGLFFWNTESKNAFISLDEISTEKELTQIMRLIFEKIRLKPNIDTIKKLKKMKQVKKQNSLLKDIWPFLIIFVVIIATIGVLSQYINPLLFDVVIISTIILFILMGVFIFKHRDQLSENTFKSIVTLLINQLPLLKGDNERPKEK